MNSRLMSLGPITATLSSHLLRSFFAKSIALGTFSKPGHGFSPICAMTLILHQPWGRWERNERRLHRKSRIRPLPRFQWRAGFR